MNRDKLTEIYNTANKIPPGKSPPITSERIFTAMQAIATDRDNWKRMAELEYGRLRVALYGDKELGYPVEGALDALFEKMVKGEWPK